MKINRKSVLTTAAVLGVIALAAGGTIAYFTDKESADNRFTVGSVDVTLYESQLHRMNSGRPGNFISLESDPDTCDWTDRQTADRGDMTKYDKTKYCTPNKALSKNDTTGMSAIDNGHESSTASWISGETTWGYSDATIKADADAYKAVDDPSTVEDESGYFTRVSENIVPGQYLRKFTYVTNDGDSDAYVLIRYMIPEEYASKVTVEVPHTPYQDNGVGAYFSVVKKSGGKYVAGDVDEFYNETIDNVNYRIYAAVTNDVVNPNEMTFWSPVNAIKLNNTEVQTKENDGSVSYPIDVVDVKVDAQAIQAKTFADAFEAINNL